MARTKRGKAGDKLNIQIALKIGLPPGTKIKKKVLDEIIERLINDKPLPKNVEVRGIFWQNPNRAGALSYWRYHQGADKSVGPRPIESTPRGSLQDAIDTLAPFLSQGRVTF